MPAGDEVQVLSVRRPGRPEVDARAVAQPRGPGGGQFVEIEVAAPVAGRREAEGQPASVGREGLVVDLALLVLRDLPGRTAVGAHGPQAVLAVAERQGLAVGRKDRAVEIALGERGQQPFGSAFRRANGDLRRAAGVGRIGDGLAVGRPGGMILVDPLRSGQIAGGAVFGRHAEDVAARREQRALAVGGERVVHLPGRVAGADLALDGGDVRAGARIVVGQIDLNLAHLLARQVERVELAALLEGDRVAAESGEVDVVVGEVGDFTALPVVLVVDPDIGAAIGVLVGQVIDLAAIPHRRSIGARPACDLGQLPAVEVVGEHLLRQAAVVAFPGAEIAEDAVVGDGVSVGPEGRQADRAVDRHGRGRAAGHRDLVHFLDPAVPLVALGQVDNVLRIRRPGDDHVVGTMAPAGAALSRRMVGEPPRRAAGRRNHPDVGPRLARLRIGDPLAVGRDAREHVLAGRAGQPLRRPARLRHSPDIAVGHEDHPVSGRLGEARKRGLRADGRDRGEQNRQQGSGERHG